MKRNAFTPENITYATLVAAGVVIILISVGIILPNVQKSKEFSKSIVDMRSYMEERLARAQKLKKSSGVLSEIKNQSESWNNAVLAKGDELKLIKFIEDLGKKNNVALKITATPSKLKTGALKSGFDIDLQTSANFKNTMQFVHEIDQSDYYIDFKEMRVQKTESSRNQTRANNAQEQGQQEAVVFTKLNGTVYTY